MRIMTSNFIKSAERDALYKDKKGATSATANDSEYAQYVEERANTCKMSNILKRLGTPKKRTNMNFHYREQLKENGTRKVKGSCYPINPEYDIQLKAMRFEKMHRLKGGDPKGKDSAGLVESINAKYFRDTSIHPP
jgi:hypothetical protein